MREREEEATIQEKGDFKDDIAIYQLFNLLYDDMPASDHFNVLKPLLAHYTSVPVLEKILKNDEVWFSNPLFMNDLDEVRFGMLQGAPMIVNNEEIASACGTTQRAVIFKERFNYFYNEFCNKQVLDIYIFCMSEHDKDNNDGLLSMWRGYGGNGSGVAIVFDTSQLNTVERSPLIIAKVSYLPNDKRIDWINMTASKFASILKKSDIPDDKLWLAAFALFTRLILFSLFTKHHGFNEEKEWRIAYLKNRDTKGILEPMFDYLISPRGVEPKLKFKVQPIEGLTENDLSLNKLIDRIILGPCASSPIAKATIQRMLGRLEKTELIAKVQASKIPFRII